MKDGQRQWGFRQLKSFEGNSKNCASAHDHFNFLWPFLKFAFFMPQCIKFIFINLLTAHTKRKTGHIKSQSTDRWEKCSNRK